MSFIETVKSIASDEKVQMFALGVVTGAVVTAAVACLRSNKDTVVAAAAETVKPADDKTADVAEEDNEAAEEKKEDNDNPKGESVE